MRFAHDLPSPQTTTFTLSCVPPPSEGTLSKNSTSDPGDGGLNFLQAAISAGHIRPSSPFERQAVYALRGGRPHRRIRCGAHSGYRVECERGEDVKLTLGSVRHLDVTLSFHVRWRSSSYSAATVHVRGARPAVFTEEGDADDASPTMLGEQLAEMAAEADGDYNGIGRADG